MNRPKHYSLDPEPWKVVRAWGLNFNLGNVIKYLSRCGRKEGNTALQDLMKARNYIDFEIEWIKKEEEKREGN